MARVTETRWIACAVRDEIAFGLQPGGELQVAEFFGTMCAIDPKPARLRTPEIIGMFRLFADLIAFHLEAQDRIAHSNQALLDARQSAALREQFIAVLGHDLRSPLSAIAATATVLERTAQEPKASSMAALIRRSAARMGELISDVMDFARGRLGGGMQVALQPQVQLGHTLEQVVAELQAATHGRVIESDIALTRTVTCDSGRIAQLLSNLIGNAVAHGDPAGAVKVEARTEGETFELSVTNAGPVIPQQGLGLGLYITSEIARGHGGRLDVESSGGHTRFTFRMPVELPSRDLSR